MRSSSCWSKGDVPECSAAGALRLEDVGFALAAVGMAVSLQFVDTCPLRLDAVGTTDSLQRKSALLRQYKDRGSGWYTGRGANRGRMALECGRDGWRSELPWRN